MAAMTHSPRNRRHKLASFLVILTLALSFVLPAYAQEAQVADEEIAYLSDEDQATEASQDTMADFETAHNTGCMPDFVVDFPTNGTAVQGNGLIWGRGYDAGHTGLGSGMDVYDLYRGETFIMTTAAGGSRDPGHVRADLDAAVAKTDMRGGFFFRMDWSTQPGGDQRYRVLGRTACAWEERAFSVNVNAAPPPPATSLSISDETRTVGTNDVTFNFTVTLSNSTTQTVTVNYATSDGSASGSDYASTSGTLTFASGVTSMTIPVRVYGRSTSDTSSTFDRDFFVRLSNANVSISDGEGRGRIQRSGFGSGQITISPASCIEGNPCVFTVTRFGSTDFSGSVTFNTRNGTGTGAAIAGIDYTQQSGTLFFSSGSFSQTREISILTTAIAGTQGNRVFYVDLTTGSFTIPQGIGTGTISDGTTATTIGISPVSATCTEGGAACTFAVTATGGSGTFTVNWTAVGSGTFPAIGGAACGPVGVDFAPISATGVSVTVGGASPIISISACADAPLVDPGETFTVTLSSPSPAATLSPPSAVGTIP